MALRFDAERYENASTHQREWGDRLIAELELSGNERVLDVGCGTGTLTSQLADLVPNGSVLGIDSSPTMVDAARHRRRSNLAFEQVNVTESSFHDEFDLIFSNATLHWVKDHDNLLSLVYCALKTGGVLRINFAADGNCSTLIRVVRDLIDADSFREAFKDFAWPWYMPTVNAYQESVQRIPFADAHVWGETADRHFPDAKAMVAWIDQPSLVPFREHVDIETGGRFRNAVVDRMIAGTKQEDGRHFETFRRINVLAQK